MPRPGNAVQQRIKATRRWLEDNEFDCFQESDQEGPAPVSEGWASYTHEVWFIANHKNHSVKVAIYTREKDRVALTENGDDRFLDSFFSEPA